MAGASSPPSSVVAETISTTSTGDEESDPLRSAVITPLTPGDKFMIIEKATGRAMCLTDNGICMQDIQEGQSNRWLCVEGSGYLGLQDPRTGRYLGHDGKFGLQASATEFRAWEHLTTRDHPGGGYWLLVPHWWHTLRTVVVAEDGQKLVTREHGDTLWYFLKMSSHER